MKIYKAILIGLLSVLVSVTVHASCDADKEAAKMKCSGEELQAAKAAFAAGASLLAANNVGAAKTAEDAKTEANTQQGKIIAANKACVDAINKCSTSCDKEKTATQTTNPPKSQQAAKNKDYCVNGDPAKTAEAQKKAGGDLGEMMKALTGLLAALGAQQTPPEAPQQSPCTTNPSDPQCVTDKATNDAGSTLTSGEFRRDAGAAFADGDLAGEAAPVAGPPAAQTVSAPMAGGAPVNLSSSGGGGGRNSPSRDREKKSEFDGSPKINLASGFAGGGSGGGKSGGGSGGGSKSSANPLASRASIDGDSQAGKIAQAAEDRLRGPASNEPLGGVSSVYYLDNFTKVEKRIMNERNTLQEH